MDRRIAPPRRERRLAAFGAVIALAQALLALVVAAPPASASAPGCPVAVHDAFGVESRIEFDFAPQCTDGSAYIDGTLADVACDAKAGKGRFVLYDRRPDGSLVLISNRGWIWTAGNGCGTSTTFGTHTNSPGTIGWRLVVQTQACNSWGSCSPLHSRSYDG